MISRFWDMVRAELEKVRKVYPNARTFNEAWGILQEEVDELWSEIKRQHKLRDPAAILRETVQVAAMAQRTAEDLLIDGRLPMAVSSPQGPFDAEAQRQAAVFGPTVSVVDGYGILASEVQDWREVTRRDWRMCSQKDRDMAYLILIRIAAYAQRMAEDCGLLTQACPEAERAAADMIAEGCPHGD